MLNINALSEFRNQHFFDSWSEDVSAKRIKASEQSIRALIDALIKLGPNAQEPEVQKAVRDCVTRFNKLDRSWFSFSRWISTIEREDICDCLSRVVELCGIDGSADWIGDNREW